MWIVYAWSFVCRPKDQRTIFVPVYWFRSLTNAFNVSWIFLWGSNYIIAAGVILYGFALTYWISNAFLVIFFNRVNDKATMLDKIITWLLPINSMFFYTTWVSLAAQLNLTIVITHFTSLGKENSGTVGLSLCALLLLVYATLELVIGVQYLQYIYTVYPVVIWACIGILFAHWDDQEVGIRNKVFTIVLLATAAVLYVAKIVLSAIYGRFMCIKARGGVVRRDRVVRLKK